MAEEVTPWFIVAMALVTVIYGALTAWAVSKWDAEQPRTATLAQAEGELRRRTMARAQRSRRQALQQAGPQALFTADNFANGDALVTEYNGYARALEQRDAHVPLRLARTVTALHPPIMGPSAALDELMAHRGAPAVPLSVTQSGATARDGTATATGRHAQHAPRATDVTAPSLEEQPPHVLVRSGALGQRPPSVALRLAVAPAPHNRWLTHSHNAAADRELSAAGLGSDSAAFAGGGVATPTHHLQQQQQHHVLDATALTLSDIQHMSVGGVRQASPSPPRPGSSLAEALRSWQRGLDDAAPAMQPVEVLEEL